MAHFASGANIGLAVNVNESVCLSQYVVKLVEIVADKILHFTIGVALA